jgi:hypothetical protein
VVQVRSRALFGAFLGALSLTACGGGSSTPPSSSPPPGSGDAIQITGRERFGWNQTADDITTYHFAVYVDNARVELPQAVCRASASAGYDCDSPLPPLTPGAHKLEVVSWISVNGDPLESPRALPLMVFVTGVGTASAQLTSNAMGRPSSAPASAAEARNLSESGISTGCGLTSVSEHEFMIWDETGQISAVDNRSEASRVIAWRTADNQRWTLSGIAVHPRFTETHWLYLAELRGAGDPRLRLSRYRELGDILGERAVLLETSLPFQPSRTDVTLGSDGRLYVALLGPPATARGDSAVPNGRFLVRLDENGIPPADNESGSIFARTSASQVLAIAWTPDDPRPWVVEPAGDGRYVLRQTGSDVQESFTAAAPAVALQFAPIEGGQRAFVTGAHGDVQRIDRRASVWTLRAPMQVFNDGRTIRDALLLPDGELVTCGPVAGDQPGYRASVSRLPF